MGRKRKETTDAEAARINAERYAAHKEAMAQRSRERTAAGADIGAIPEIADIARRERCRTSLYDFCQTYNPEAFSLPWADYQRESIARIEEAVRFGALYALAEPRGGGKTTRCRMAALWALSYGWSRYVFLIGSNAEKATDNLAAIKTYARFLPEYAADFPEISYPVQRLQGRANRAAGQTCGSEPTLIEWTGDRIVLPTVPPPANWPAHWPLRADGMVPTSGSAVSVSGLTGEGIRGSLLTLSTGESIRPDFVLLDDPQTNESARSRSQNATREQLISADVLGMAGPNKKMSAVMPCTVVEPGDAMDVMLDRDKHPLWRGQRTRMLVSMPENMAEWDDYFEVYRRCSLREPPDLSEANEYYLKHRQTLDRGASPSWPARFKDGEVSAIQSAMHLYYRNPRSFAAEYQNEPLAAQLGQLEELDGEQIMRRVSRLERLHIPQDCERLTAFIDCQSKILYYCITAWNPRFGGSVVDYGTYPQQKRSYFISTDARPSLSDVFPNYDEEARLYAGLRETVSHIVERKYTREGGGFVPISLVLIDSGDWTERVHEFVQRSNFGAILLASKGFGISSGSAPMANWVTKPGERVGDHWRVRAQAGKYGRTCLFDTNYWKSFVARRLQSPEGGAGFLSIFGNGELRQHQLFSEHLTSEYRTVTKRVTGDQREIEEWKMRPGRPENHWWDCLIGSAVAASVCGTALSAAVSAGEAPAQKHERRKVKLSEILAQKRR